MYPKCTLFGLNCGYKTAELIRFNLSCFLRICAVSILLKLCLLIKLDPFFQISPFWSSHHHGDTAAGLLGNFCPIVGRTMTSQFIILACRLTSFLERVSCILCFLSPEGLSSFLFTVWLFVFLFLILSHILESTHLLDGVTLKFDFSACLVIVTSSHDFPLSLSLFALWFGGLGLLESQNNSSAARAICVAADRERIWWRGGGEGE